MQYLERTLQVKAALLRQPDILEKIQNIFASHLSQDHVHKPVSEGNSRVVYEVGSGEIAPGVKINLLLKLMKDKLFMRYSHAAERSKFSALSEFGAFEMYYDFVAGHISIISFRTKAGYEKYCDMAAFGTRVTRTFSLADDWGGTQVAQGDLGAIPYFNLVIRHKGWFGQLTEGEPPLIEPKDTAECRGTMDDYTIEMGRIIDLGSIQCLLIDIDQGGGIKLSERYPGNLGVRHRGEKYFCREHRLDI